MARLFKFLHVIATIGLVGSLAALLAMVTGAARLPADQALVTHQALVWTLYRVTLPSVALLWLTGLLSIAVRTAFLEMGWVWVKLILGMAHDGNRLHRPVAGVRRRGGAGRANGTSATLRALFSQDVWIARSSGPRSRSSWAPPPRPSASGARGYRASRSRGPAGLTSRIPGPRAYCPALRLGRRMDVVHPVHRLRFLHHRNVEIHHHRLLAAAAEHAGQRLGVGGIDLLVRHEGRHVDEIAGPGFGDELERVAPAHARLAAHHVDHALDRAVMMRAGLGLGVDHDRAGPQLLRAAPRMGDGRRAVHALRLRGVGVELGASHHAHAVEFPVRIGHFAWSPRMNRRQPATNSTSSSSVGTHMFTSDR